MKKITLAEPKKVTAKEAYCNKQNTAREYLEQIEKGEYTDTDLRVFKVIEMENILFESFTTHLLHDFTFLQGVPNGTASDYKPDKENYWDLTADELKQFMAASYICAIEVRNVDTGAVVYVNTEGYNYARYCYFE